MSILDIYGYRDQLMSVLVLGDFLATPVWVWLTFESKRKK